MLLDQGFALIFENQGNGAMKFMLIGIRFVKWSGGLFAELRRFWWLMISTLLLMVACITVDNQGRRIDDERTNSREEIWDINQMPLGPAWRADDERISYVLAPVPVVRPEVFTIEGILPAGDQGPQASGTAWAAGYLAMSHLQRSHNPDYICSPAFVYNVLNQGRDHGLEIVDALQLLKYTGCPPAEAMPYRQTDFRTQPDTNVLETANEYRIEGFGRVDLSDRNQIRGHLLQGKPIIATIIISENFLNHRQRVFSELRGDSLGRHTVTIIGYDDIRRLWLIQNSAGQEWGHNGRTYVPYNWFARLVTQAYVIW